MSFYRTMYALLNPLVRLCYRLEIRGEENIPVDSGCILAANHTAFSVVLIVSAAAKRQVRYMGEKGAFSDSRTRRTDSGDGRVSRQSRQARMWQASSTPSD